MNTELSREQQQELKRREKLHQENEILYGKYDLRCKCGHKFIEAFEVESIYEVEGVKYPFITNYQNH